MTAVVIAMLVPALNQGTKRALTAQCTANLRNIGVGVFQYAAENNDRLPDAQSFGIQTIDPIITTLATYVGATNKVWDCPANPKLRSVVFSGYVQGNYATAFYFGHPQTGKAPYTLLQVREFAPEKRWLLADMDGWIYANPNVVRVSPLPVHQKGRNVLYADGRVQWIASKLNVVP